MDPAAQVRQTDLITALLGMGLLVVDAALPVPSSPVTRIPTTTKTRPLTPLCELSLKESSAYLQIDVKSVESMDPDVAARLVGRRTVAPFGRRAAWSSRSWTRPRGAHGVLRDWRPLWFLCHFP